MTTSGSGQPAIDAEVAGERRHLTSLAFRMLGTLAEAEDAVQETYARWYRMPAAEREAIEVPRAWLTRVAGRVCLDVLDSARMRRERYIGPWLPEPVPSSTFDEEADPLDRMAREESVSMALMLVLEAMTPAERVTFVLHDVFSVPFDEIAEVVGRSAAACRQLATSARRRVQQSRSRTVSGPEHDAVVRAFWAAARDGDLARLVAVLDPQVVLRSDGGGTVTAARNPVLGSDRVGRFVLGLLVKNPEGRVVEQQTDDGLGFVLWNEGRVIGVATFAVAAGAVTELWIVMNPEKLTLWR